MTSKNLIINSEFIRRFNLAKEKRGFVHDSEVADLAGISRPTVSDWRKGRGKPSRRTTIALGDVLNVNPNWLRIESEPEPAWDLDSVLPAPEKFKAGTVSALKLSGIERFPDEVLIDEIEKFYSQRVKPHGVQSSPADVNSLIQHLVELQERSVENLVKRRKRTS